MDQKPRLLAPFGVQELLPGTKGGPPPRPTAHGGESAVFLHPGLGSRIRPIPLQLDAIDELGSEPPSNIEGGRVCVLDATAGLTLVSGLDRIVFLLSVLGVWRLLRREVVVVAQRAAGELSRARRMYKYRRAAAPSTMMV